MTTVNGDTFTVNINGSTVTITDMKLSKMNLPKHEARKIVEEDQEQANECIIAKTKLVKANRFEISSTYKLT